MKCISDACSRSWLQGLRGSEGLRMFHIVRVSDSTRLPQVILFTSDAISMAQLDDWALFKAFIYRYYKSYQLASNTLK